MASDAAIARAIRNLLNLQRVGNGLTREVNALLDQLFRELAELIARNDPTAVSRRVYRDARVAKILTELRGLTGRHMGEVRKLVRQRLAEIGAASATVAEGTLSILLADEAVEIVRAGMSINRLKAILDAGPFASDDLKGWFTRLDELTASRVRREIQAGMTVGETLDQIVRRVRGGRSGGRLIRGVLQTTKRDAEAITRTGINFVSNRAYLETYQANADVITGLEFTSTLDSRTSDLCISADGRVLDVMDPDPAYIPPLHPRCRSVLTPRTALDVEGIRASETGPQSGSTSYEDWFRKQPPSKQNEIIGKAKAELFRAGKISLKDLVTRDRRILTVEELRGT